jgi:hypothetical protein
VSSSLGLKRSVSKTTLLETPLGEISQKFVP